MFSEKDTEFCKAYLR